MKLRHIVCTIAIVFCCSLSWGWVCPTGQHWSQVANGTPGATVIQGLSFVCVSNAPTDPSGTSAQATSTSTANSNATGGNATATGGSVSNSGNSNVRLSNTLSQSQKQGQSQSSSNTNTNDNTSQGGSVSNVGNSVTNIPRQAPPAYAPTVLPTNCLGSISAGASAPVGGLSIGGTKRDRNCESIVLANMFAQLKNFAAAAKVLCATDAAKRAKLTEADCIAVEAAIEVPHQPAPAPLATPVFLLDHPAPPPQIILLEPPIDVTPTKDELREAGLDKPIVKAKPIASHKPQQLHRVGKPCVVPDSLKTPMEK